MQLNIGIRVGWETKHTEPLLESWCFASALANRIGCSGIPQEFGATSQGSGLKGSVRGVDLALRLCLPFTSRGALPL